MYNFYNNIFFCIYLICVPDRSGKQLLNVDQTYWTCPVQKELPGGNKGCDNNSAVWNKRKGLNPTDGQMHFSSCSELKGQGIHLEGKPRLRGRTPLLSGGLTLRIFFSQLTPKTRYRGDVRASQWSQTGTEPGRCSDQTYPHSKWRRSSQGLTKTFKSHEHKHVTNL